MPPLEEQLARIVAIILSIAAIGGILVVACWLLLRKIGLISLTSREIESPRRKATTALPDRR